MDKIKKCLLIRVPTSLCNLRCRYCYISQRKENFAETGVQADLKYSPEQWSIALSKKRLGGTLLYSTCTVQRNENEDVISAFLSEDTRFALEPISLPWLSAPDGMHTFWPHIDGTDGFFVAKLRKHV